MPSQWAKLASCFVFRADSALAKEMSGFSTPASSVKIRYIGTSRARVIFPERIDARNGVAVLDARDVASKQTRTFLNITLRYWFLFSQLFQSFANNH